MDKNKILINLKSQKRYLGLEVSSSNQIAWASEADRGSIFKVFAVYLTSYGNLGGKW